MQVDLYVKNGQVVTETAVFPGGVAIKHGRIAQLIHGDAELDAREVIDVGGNHILPGVVDPHVHLSEPGTDYEGFETGSYAAAAGGITSLIEMPMNAMPPTVDKASLELKQAVVRQKTIMDIGLWGGLVDKNEANLADLAAGGVLALKAFMSDPGPGYDRVDDDVLYAGMQFAAAHGLPVGVHAENEYLTRHLRQTLAAAGRTDLAAWPESRPPFEELEAIQRAIALARATGVQLHIVHVSLGEGVKTAVSAKNSGVNLTVETCPQYLLLDHDDFLRIGPTAKCAPPIRSRAHVEALWECVLAGQVDVIASDHSPCLLTQKATSNVWDVWGGISGLQTMLPGLLTEGVIKRGLPLPALVRMMSANPARIFGLYPRKGAMLPGSDADLVVVDMDRPWTLTADQLFQRNKHSAFVGYGFKTAVVQTIRRGETIYANGQITARPGSGQLLSRRHSPV